MGRLPRGREGWGALSGPRSAPALAQTSLGKDGGAGGRSAARDEAQCDGATAVGAFAGPDGGQLPPPSEAAPCAPWGGGGQGRVRGRLPARVPEPRNKAPARGRQGPLSWKMRAVNLSLRELIKMLAYGWFLVLTQRPRRAGHPGPNTGLPSRGRALHALERGHELLTRTVLIVLIY